MVRPPWPITMPFWDSRSTNKRDPNVHGPFGFAKLLHFGGKGIGQLVAEQLEGCLTEVLHHEEAERLGPDVVGIVGELSLGQLLAEAREQVRAGPSRRRR